MAGTVSTGIRKLDETLGGGIIRGSIIVLIGEPGTGKTSLIRNFVKAGLDGGDTCIYLMTNRSLDHVLASTANTGWNVGEAQNLKFMLYNGVVTKRVKSFVGNFEDLIDVAYNCERLVSSTEPGRARMVIDDLSYMFLINNKDVIFKFLNRMCQILREHEVTCLLELQRGMLDPQIVTALESITDGTIETRRQGDKRSFRVSRMEGVASHNDWVDLSFASGTGLGIEAEKTLDEWENIIGKDESKRNDEDVSNKLVALKQARKKEPNKEPNKEPKKKRFFRF